MSEINVLEVLRGSLLTTGLDDVEAQALADRMETTTLRDGEVLVAQGHRCQMLFVQAAGTIQIYQDRAGSDEVLHQMEVGECVGTRSFIDGSASPFGLRAVEDSVVLTLKPAALEALEEAHPGLPYKVMRAFVLITYEQLARLRLEGAELRGYVFGTGGRH